MTLVLLWEDDDNDQHLVKIYDYDNCALHSVQLLMMNILKTISISDRSPPPIVRRLLQMLINSAAIAV